MLNNAIRYSLPSLQSLNKSIFKIKALDYLSKMNQPIKKVSDLTKTEKERLSIADFFHDLETEGRRLYMLTLTYNYGNKKEEHQKIMAEKTSIHFYQYSLLPHLTNKKNFYRQPDLPICFSFLDDQPYERKRVGIHSHMIMAVKNTIDLGLQKLKGFLLPHEIVKMNMPKNSIQQENGMRSIDRIRSFDIQRCERGEVVTLYASKSIQKYPEYKVFGYKKIINR
ncbi:MAG: hypothetical protein CBD16_04040 [Betaproteobacteria bacterium TMED156]|nr:MAG: hypothetical protein CBD16_04040 [Betaproteobacteria bacterium TMED156]